MKPCLALARQGFSVHIDVRPGHPPGLVFCDTQPWSPPRLTCRVQCSLTRSVPARSDHASIGARAQADGSDVRQTEQTKSAGRRPRLCITEDEAGRMPRPRINTHRKSPAWPTPDRASYIPESQILLLDDQVPVAVIRVQDNCHDQNDTDDDILPQRIDTQNIQT